MSKAISYASGTFAMKVDGMDCGYIAKAGGGFPTVEKNSTAVSSTNVVKTTVSNLKYDPITVKLGIGHANGMYQWMTEYFDKNATYKSGEIISANYDGDIKNTLTFMNAYLQEVKFPALDATSKDGVMIECKLQPEYTERAAGSGKIDGNIGSKQKQWLCSNWRISVGALPCDNVTKIDGLSYTMKLGEVRVGSKCVPTWVPGAFEVGELTLTILANDIDAWQDEAKVRLFEGKNLGEGAELTGGITFLGPDLSTELGTVELGNMGITSFKVADQEANKEAVHTFEVKMYYETMRFSLNETDG
jgi:phage tail-like protein